MDLRQYLALAIGKLAQFMLKISGSGATAAPGLIALKIDPNLVKKLSSKIPQGSIIISGTNGKTTTARLIFDMLSKNYAIVHNRQGSNLMRGIASALISKANPTGNIKADLAVWEIDEATLPQAIDSTNPKTIVLLNLFRDQLDRYGEVEITRKKWQEALTNLPKETTLILNADDPGIASLSKITKAKMVTFGIKDHKISRGNQTGVLDIKSCPICQGKLDYKSYTLGHLGEYLCTKCGFKKPNLQLFASDIDQAKDFSTSMNLVLGAKKIKIKYKLPGIYNAYNILASAAVGQTYALSPKDIAKSTENFSPVFGRFQSVQIGNKSVLIFLIKNPTGANEVVKVLSQQSALNLLVILNDNFADGRDVSWIWDTKWEALSQKTKKLTISGTRAWDMATRLKYANFNLSKNNVYEQIETSIEAATTALSNNDTLVILPTYTALMPVEKSLSKYTKIVKWHKQ